MTKYWRGRDIYFAHCGFFTSGLPQCPHHLLTLTGAGVGCVTVWLRRHFELSGALGNSEKPFKHLKLPAVKVWVKF